MPLIVLTASSTLSVISVSISCGDEPRFVTVTVIVGKSTFGKRSTPRLKNENAPTTTNEVISIVANTGRLTHISANHCIRLPLSDQRAVSQRSDVACRHHVTLYDALFHLDHVILK